MIEGDSLVGVLPDDFRRQLVRNALFFIWTEINEESGRTDASLSDAWKAIVTLYGANEHPAHRSSVRGMTIAPAALRAARSDKDFQALLASMTTSGKPRPGRRNNG